MSNMLKKRYRNFAMLMEAKIASNLLRFFKTCDLVFELERRIDVCQTMYLGPKGHYYIDMDPDEPNSKVLEEDGPAVVLVVVD